MYVREIATRAEEASHSVELWSYTRPSSVLVAVVFTLLAQQLCIERPCR